MSVELGTVKRVLERTPVVLRQLLLDLPPDQRVEATAATTVLGIAAGVDIVRVHDVRDNVRAARVADAVLRGWRPAGWPAGGAR